MQRRAAAAASRADKSSRGKVNELMELEIGEYHHSRRGVAHEPHSLFANSGGCHDDRVANAVAGDYLRQPWRPHSARRARPGCLRTAASRAPAAVAPTYIRVSHPRN